MEYIFKLIELINSAQLVAIGIMLWFFYNRLDSKIEKNTQRIDNVYALIINLFQIKRIDDLSNNQDKAA